MKSMVATALCIVLIIAVFGAGIYWVASITAVDYYSIIRSGM